MDMNLSTLTDDKLHELVKACDERRERLATNDGQAQTLMEMLRLFEYLEASGYHMPLKENRQLVARVWAEQLAECIITYGFPVIRDAVKRFIETDTREFRQAPNAADIKAIAKNMGFNPKRELAIRRLEAEEAKRREEANKKAEEWRSRQSAERLEEIRQRVSALSEN